jgi:hypothetical protein
LNISNFPSTYPLPSDQVSSLQQVTINNVAAGLYIPVNIGQVTTTLNTQDTIVGVAAGVYIPITIHNVEAGVVFNINISSISSGVTFNINIASSAVPLKMGQVKPALSFDGVNDYVEVSDSSSLHIWSEDWSIEFLVYRVAAGGQLFFKYTGGGSGYVRVRAEGSSNLTFILYDGANIFSYDVNITNLVWQHCVITHVASTKTLTWYRNGVSQTPATHTLNLSGVNPLGVIRLGHQISWTTWFNGLIGEARIYNRALSANEILCNYNNPNSPVTNGLVLWLPLGEGAGTTAYDKSGNNNNGTVYGATWVSSEGSVPCTVNVNIAGQVQALNVNVASAVTLNVNISSCTAAINVQTSSGVNLVIDKLTQAAYVEDRRTLSNDSWTTPGQAPPYYKTGQAYNGKFFPRGCRGMIEGDSIYAKGNGSDTITLAYTPQPGMGPVLTSTFTPGTDWTWCGNALDFFWPYDSCFIYISSCGASVQWGYDQTAPYDGRGSTNQGQTWMRWDARPWIRLPLTMETVGDLPVSGTLNTVPLPTATSGASSGSQNIPAGQTVTLLTLNGPGRNLHLELYTNMYVMVFTVLCDGAYLYAAGGYEITAQMLNNDGYTASTSGFQLLKYNATAGQVNVFAITFPFEWKRKLVIVARNPDTSSRVANCTINYLRLLG